MSDMAGGPDWWQASDGKWYPPEAASGAAAPTPAGIGVPPSTMGPGPDVPVDAKGFFKSLYDFQFDHFVTPKLIRLFYAIFVIALSIVAVLMFLGALASGSEGVFVALIIIPIFYVLYLIITRVYFELIAALFRIADDLRAIRRSKGL
ncbi:MAG: DUF4282 domain-containing protein [Acidimicrobiales bacterium]|nr:DUF4282 domain-containing protein [Acidimicrobiales bacterium]